MNQLFNFEERIKEREFLTKVKAISEEQELLQTKDSKKGRSPSPVAPL